MWGWIAWSLGGKKGLRESCCADRGAESLQVPDEIMALLAKDQISFWLDEVLQNLISATV